MSEDIEQLSPEWFAIRRGKVTASRLSDLTAVTKSGWAASRAVYMAELIAEILTDTTATRFASPAMEWGVTYEPDARSAYEFHKDVHVLPAAFVIHPRISRSGASPDGLVGSDGLLEIKCPQTNTHIDTLMNGNVNSRYFTQVQWQMACTGRAWTDFVSFDPRMPEHMRLFIKRIPRDDAMISKLESQVDEFLAEMHSKLDALTSKYGKAA